MSVNRHVAGLLLLLALIQTGTVIPAPGLEVRLAADTLSVQADQVPLKDILAQLQEAGIRVAMDERINPLITAHFENRDIGNGIKRLLADCDYALSWQTLEGPAGNLRRLSEILVYKPGDRRTLTPRPASFANLLHAKTARTNAIICLNNEILIRLRPGTTPEQFRKLLLETGSAVMDGIPALGLYRIHTPPDTNLPDLLNSLGTNPVVARAEPNPVYRSIPPERETDSGAPEPPRTLRPGTGPAVAVLDSGFTPNAALDNVVVATLDATDPAQAITDPMGHGTQMAFIAAGVVPPLGTEGSDAAVPIIPIRTMNDQGITSGFALMQSIVFALDNGARVISMSWGTESDTGFFNDTLAYARQRGAVLVAAAGNEPTGRPLYPASHPDVISVAALQPDGTLWPQSNFGPTVRLAAPGFADLPVGYRGPPGRYGGTSISAAYTAQTLSRYFSAHPGATASDAVTALMKSLTSTPGPGGTGPAGIPRLDAAAQSAFLKP